MRYIVIGLGAICGAILRDSVTRLGLFWGISTLWSIAVVNIIASFLAGMAWQWGVLSHMSPEMRLLVVVGFLGSLSTFSTFSVDIWSLMAQKQYSVAFLYVAVSLLLSFLAVMLGVLCIRIFLRT